MSSWKSWHPPRLSQRSDPMAVRPEISITVLPHFRPSLLRAESIMLARPRSMLAESPTVDIEWRFPTKDELSRLLRNSVGVVPKSRLVGIFEIPRHLRNAWWKAAEEITAIKDRTGPKFQSFTGRLAEFLRYKRVSLAEQSRFDVILAPPEGVSVECGESVGSEIPSLAINLGDGNVDAVIANGRLNPASLDCAPIVRLTLEPGEGLSFPLGTAAHCERRNAEGETVLLLRISPETVVSSGA